MVTFANKFPLALCFAKTRSISICSIRESLSKFIYKYEQSIVQVLSYFGRYSLIEQIEWKYFKWFGNVNVKWLSEIVLKIYLTFLCWTPFEI